LDQSSTITVTPTGGVAPFKVSFTMDRPINCNLVNSSGDEVWTPGANTNSSSNTTCPSSGPSLLKPVSTSNPNIPSGGSYLLTVTLMQDATITATITDANGCSTTVTTFIHAEDVRCFAGNSGNAKVTVCHRTGSANNPCVTICVDNNAVAAHLAHGDFLGNCTPNCVAPYTTSLGTVANNAVAEVSPSKDFNVKVFPNPSQDQFSLYLEGASNDKVHIVVYDAIGREVKKFEKEGGNIPVIFGRDLIGGAYFVEVRQGNNHKTVKLIKQN
jgi:hypothetical protein